MENKNLNNQIKANKFRIIVGIISLVVMWGLFIYKNLMSGMFLYILIGFSIIDLILYIMLPLMKNKKLNQELDE